MGAIIGRLAYDFPADSDYLDVKMDQYLKTAEGHDFMFGTNCTDIIKYHIGQCRMVSKVENVSDQMEQSIVIGSCYLLKSLKQRLEILGDFPVRNEMKNNLKDATDTITDIICEYIYSTSD